MRIIKNIFVGFVISFIGSLPLGYLNVIGYDIYSRSGFINLSAYNVGVICIEAFAIYFTLVFAERLSKKKKLLKHIELFSIFFLFFLAGAFYFSSGGRDAETSLDNYVKYPPFIIGILLSCVNFLQLPFWTGWNLYLISNNYIVTDKGFKFLYLVGTLCGTFAGMTAFVLLLDLVTTNSNVISENSMSLIIPLIFVGLAIFQLVKFYRKDY